MSKNEFWQNLEELYNYWYGEEGIDIVSTWKKYNLSEVEEEILEELEEANNYPQVRKLIKYLQEQQ